MSASGRKRSANSAGCESIGQGLHEGGEHEPIVERGDFFHERRLLRAANLSNSDTNRQKFDRRIDGAEDVEGWSSSAVSGQIAVGRSRSGQRRGSSAIFER